jgi:hypothetical protein
VFYSKDLLLILSFSILFLLGNLLLIVLALVKVSLEITILV